MMQKKTLKILSSATSVATAIIGLAAAQGVYADESQHLPVDVGDCVDLESPEERFACYEERANAALHKAGDEEAGDAASAAPEERSEARRERANESEAHAANESETGAPDDRDRASRTFERETNERREIVATIKALRETVPNSYVITLDNGQVWRQMAPKVYNFQPGDQVRIYPSHWGKSYRLTVEKLRGFIQVERVH